MRDPEDLRAQAVRLYALAIKARETDTEYADQLVTRAIQLQDEAAAIEEVALSFNNPKRHRRRRPVARQREKAARPN
jgi:hypothetical protein